MRGLQRPIGPGLCEKSFVFSRLEQDGHSVSNLAILIAFPKTTVFPKMHLSQRYRRIDQEFNPLVL